MQPCTSTLLELSSQIKQWGLELGFADVGITNTDLSAYEAAHFNWIGENYHGEMDYMQRHGTKRTRPAELEPGTVSIISVRLNYLDLNAYSPFETLHKSEQAYISRYALGKDYHKLMRKRLQQLASKIELITPGFSYRAFCDSAPVLERPIAEKAGLGFIGKNSLIIHPRAGSWFFLGELYTNLALPVDPPFVKQGCGPCTACIVECPTQAIVGNAIVDARRCISYLTIEYAGSIPHEFRAKMGNRIYGCDDCQLVCPWNKFTEHTQEPAFSPKQSSDHALDQITIIELWSWTEPYFMKRFEGSPIRRIGFNQWKRNLAVAMGNIEGSRATINQAILTLQQDRVELTELINEHVDWAIQQLQTRLSQLDTNLSRPAQIDKPILKRAHVQPKPFVAPKYYLPKNK